jgi:hypothetical protein
VDDCKPLPITGTSSVITCSSTCPINTSSVSPMGKARPNMPEYHFEHFNFRTFQNSGIFREFWALSWEFGYVLRNLPPLKRFSRLNRRYSACVRTYVGTFRGITGRMLEISEVEFYQRNVW